MPSNRAAHHTSSAQLFAGIDTDALGRILDRDEVARLPKPDPLIRGWLDERAVTLLVGATGTNQSFTALGWACSVATGVPWLGHPLATDPGTAIFVVGEGGGGLGGRLDAWEADAGVTVPPDRLLFLLRPDSISDADFWEQLREVATASDTRLVVLDTFSSLASEADETKDAAPVLRHAADLAAEAHVAVVIVHHTGWSAQNRARGASQFEANADAVVVALKPKGDDDAIPDSDGPVTLWRKKVKDGQAGDRLTVERLVVGASAVLVRSSDSAGQMLNLKHARQRRRLTEAVLADPWRLTETRLIRKVTGDDTDKRARVADLLSTGVLATRVVERANARGARRTVTVYGPGPSAPAATTTTNSDGGVSS